MLGDKALVMLIDDSPFEQTFLRDTLMREGYEFISASNGLEAYSVLKKIQPDIVLLDIVMPGISGFEVCEHIKLNPTMKDTPIIFLTALGDTDDVVKGFEYGGVDYVVKPFRTEELLMRIKTHLELKSSKDLLVLKNTLLEEMMVKLEAASVTDYLTGLYNRRFAYERLHEEQTRIQRYGGKYSIILSDIDCFKAVNDEHGHLCGDQVLIEISKCMKNRLREIDIVSRFGGEEFLMILPGTDLAGAVDLAETLRRSIEALPVYYDSKEIFITMTFGVSENDGTMDISQQMHEADEALYAGKRNGRNCVVTKYFAKI